MTVWRREGESMWPDEPRLSYNASMTFLSKRPWLRFTLRTLLALMIVIAIPLAWIAKERGQSRHERQVAEQLKYYYANVMLAGPYDSLDRISQQKPQGWWPDLARSVYGERIIHVAGPLYRFDKMPLLDGLTNVQWLCIHGPKVCDLSPLAAPGYRHLQGLDVAKSGITDLTPLAGLEELRYLRLEKTQVVDLKPLSKLRLNGLHLQYTPVRDLTPLAGLTTLTELGLQGTPATREDIEALRQDLPNCRIHSSFDYLGIN